MSLQTSSSSPAGPRIVVISGHLSHPRHIRLVEALVEAGYRVTVYGFERAYYNVNALPPAAEVVGLGQVQDRHYVGRLPMMIRAALRIWSSERTRPRASLVYAFGLDNALLGYLAVTRADDLVYEVGDLRNPALEKSPVGRFMRVIEDAVLARCSLLVTTSPGFVEAYFRRRYPGIEARTLVVENRLPISYQASVQRPSPRPTSEPVRIGYVGRLRYERTFSPLLRAMVDLSGRRYELHIHGDGRLRSMAEASAAEAGNISYHGAFRNPEDLARIYCSLDVCYAVYDNRDLNVRLALPNKLYECTYFGVPLVVAADTALWQRCSAWGVGWAVDPQEEGFLADLLDGLTLEEIDRVKANSTAVDETLLVKDYGALLGWIRRATAQRC